MQLLHSVDVMLFLDLFFIKLSIYLFETFGDPPELLENNFFTLFSKVL